ncbi:flagellar protein FlaG [Candidatus Nitrospira allomarina]|uniref:Flagellar protein FlaG n=1 Tax=Candidatus Nitrospira allomarina TaxID=3020900 RepID=A0AA96GBA9_9BACT|nr:flagellar protein FlaG [Candidatus Nitrospira allomarina]WNM56840.1 flagellar protein FlaG [Candidatus Nitrospira allomarina]
MISTLSDSASFINISVGNEIRVRDGQKPLPGDAQRPFEKKAPVFPTDSTESYTVNTPLTTAQVQATVTRLQELLKHVDPRIEISLEKDINQVVFRVVDQESGDLIRQIPSENMIELERFITGQIGLFVEEDI